MTKLLTLENESTKKSKDINEEDVKTENNNSATSDNEKGMTNFLMR